MIKWQTRLLLLLTVIFEKKKPNKKPLYLFLEKSSENVTAPYWPQIMILNRAFKTNDDTKIRNRRERSLTHDILKLNAQSRVFESGCGENRDARKEMLRAPACPQRAEEQCFGVCWVRAQTVSGAALPELPPFWGPARLTMQMRILQWSPG